MTTPRSAPAARAAAAVVLLAGLMLLAPLPRTAHRAEPSQAQGNLARPAGIEAAARAARAGECSAATRLAELAPTERSILDGLYALTCGRPERARALLARVDGAGSSLEDWRLFGLAQAAAATGATEEALAVADRLAERHPASPLRVPAALLAAETAGSGEDPHAALERIERVPAEGLSRDELRRLGAAAWAAAEASRDPALERRTARRLLVEQPLLAAELRAVEVFRRPDGSVPWSDVLSPPELERRAESLLRSGLAENAVAALREIPEASRGLQWELRYAEALIESRRGAEALTRLEALGPAWRGAGGGEAEWLAARAALDAAALRRGRRNLTAREREAMTARARELLASVARRLPPGPRALDALERLAVELTEEDELEPAVEVVRELAAAAPDSRVGAVSLWRLGWRRFADGAPSAALTAWSVLDELFPGSYPHRAARYWSARAWQELGEAERASRVFAELAAPGPADFYRRQAAARTDGTAPPAPREPPPAEPWPEDPVLDRAALLTELGLDALALVELKALDEAVDPRARFALEARVLARLGEPRESIQAIRRVFPQLGTVRQDTAPAEALRLYYPLQFEEVVRAEAARRGLPPTLVLAMIRQESAFDAGARSSAGARGLMQVMPATGRELARQLGLRYSHDRLTDPEVSVRLGTAYFRQVLEMFDRSEELALAGYNAGPYRIRRLWRREGSGAELDRFVEGLPLAETRTYVKRVLLFADSYERLAG